MSQQIASLWAGLRFDVDQTGLNSLRTELQKMKSEMGAVLKDTADFNRRLKTMVGRMGQLNNVFNARGVTEWRQRLVASVRRYEEVMRSAKTQIDAFATEVQLSGNKLNWFDDRLNQNIRSLDSYRAHLEPVVLLLERLRGAAGSPLPRVGGGMTGGAVVHHGGQGTRGGAGAAGGLLEAAGVGAFLRPLLPTGMGIGGMLGAGYGFKELVQAGREMQAMEFKLKAVSENAMIFENNLSFVKNTSKDLALNVTEFGKAYSSIFQSAKSSLGVEQIQGMMTGMNKYFRTLQMTPEEIKGSLRAVGQMLNKGQVMAEELKNQLGERAAGVLQIFTKAAGMGDDVKGFIKLMEAGKVGVDIVEKAGKMMGEWADEQGTLDQSLKTSAAKQELFNNALKEMSQIILESGLDQALADLFTSLVPIISVLAKGFSLVFKFISKVLNGFKALYEYTQEHPIASSVMATVAALVLLRPILQAVAGIFLSWAVRGLFAVNAVNASLLVTKLRLWGLLGVFTYLFTAFDDFKKGIEDNPLTVWYHMVQLLISEFDLMFASIELGWARLKADPLGWWNNTDVVGGAGGHWTDNVPVVSSGIRTLTPYLEDIGGFVRKGFGFDGSEFVNPYNTPASASTVNTSNRNYIVVNVDVSKAPSVVQQGVANGDMTVLGTEVARQFNQWSMTTPNKH